MRHKLRNERSVTIFFTSIAFFVLTSLSLIVFIYALSGEGRVPNDTFFWFSFSFISGLMTIFLPCTLPLAFVAIPVAKEKRTLSALGMILMFALGVFIILALYGGALGAFGGFALSVFPDAALQSIVPWAYFLAGIFAYTLSLGELSLVPLRMPSYSGMSPDFIRTSKGSGRMFLMGLFLGNVGVGCPFPAIPLLLVSAVLSGSWVYGVLLFLIHAIGRIFPLLILLALSTLRVDGLAMLVASKEKFERISGWVFVVFTAFLITVGSYSHNWLYQTKLYAWCTSFFGDIPLVFSGSSDLPPLHGIIGVETGGGYTLLLLILLPLWWGYAREQRKIYGNPLHQVKHLEARIERLIEEERGHELALHIPEGAQHKRVKELDHRIDVLLTKRRIMEEAMRYGEVKGLRNEDLEYAERRALTLRRNWYATLTLLLIIAVYTIL